MPEDSSILKGIAHPIHNYVKQYLEVHVKRGNEEQGIEEDGEGDIGRTLIVGKLDRIEGGFAVFNPYVEYKYPKYPLSNLGEPWLEFVDKDIVQEIKQIHRIVQTEREALDRKVKHLNRAAKKRVEYEANKRAQELQNNRPK